LQADVGFALRRRLLLVTSELGSSGGVQCSDASSAALGAARKHDATFTFVPRFKAEIQREELDERFGIGGDIAANPHPAQFGIGRFKGPASLTRDLGDGFVQPLALEGEQVLWPSTSLRARALTRAGRSCFATAFCQAQPRRARVTDNRQPAQPIRQKCLDVGNQSNWVRR
jgi:hypothetical protein